MAVNLLQREKGKSTLNTLIQYTARVSPWSRKQLNARNKLKSAALMFV